MKRDTFGRQVITRLGYGSLNWEDDAIIVDEMVGEQLASEFARGYAKARQLFEFGRDSIGI